jgi:hypothetical protein
MSFREKHMKTMLAVTLALAAVTAPALAYTTDRDTAGAADNSQVRTTEQMHNAASTGNQALRRGTDDPRYETTADADPAWKAHHYSGR